ncbi:MAG TPA: hypothetical protein ENG63_01040 [Candidatus Desulfofervidus auxilii]|uniref:Doubled CXXCH motif domain-containing protein n=1 Tax=Desulfofervidus auxilii TaxID=1621989 RepID=A0A7C0U1F3_DESA2|nr:hypothetical protein [Candidatus Desulfofervidus auxilii]
MRQMILIIIILSIFSATVCFSENCLNCHKDQIKSEPYPHPPILEGKCCICHGSEIQRETKVISKYTPLSKKHFVLLELSSKSSYEGWIKVKDKRGQFAQKKIEIDIKNLPLKKDRQPPIIKSVQVVRIERGIFWTATIYWETNEPATSIVTWGEKKLHENKLENEDLVYKHEVIIAGLEGGASYSFQVHSADACGNITSSPEMKFKVIPMILSKKTQEMENPSVPLEIKRIKYYRTPQRKILISWETNVFTTGEVELRPKDKTEKVAHIVLASKKEAGLNACYRCHSSEKLGLTHPVDLPLPAEMKKSSRLPLANGCITCATCHNPHGAKLEYLLRKSHRSELCVSCHKNY